LERGSTAVAKFCALHGGRGASATDDTRQRRRWVGGDLRKGIVGWILLLLLTVIRIMIVIVMVIVVLTILEHSTVFPSFAIAKIEQVF
jgi:hypothetical protein